MCKLTKKKKVDESEEIVDRFVMFTFKIFIRVICYYFLPSNRKV